MSLVESAAARLGEDPPGFVGSIGTVFSESAQRAAFEIRAPEMSRWWRRRICPAGVTTGELIGWLTARQCGLSAPLFWYPYFKADPPYVSPTPVSRASHYRLPIPMMIGEELASSCGSSTCRRSLSTFPGFIRVEVPGSSPADND